MGRKIQVAIADDHTAFREGLISLLEKFPDISVVFDVENGQVLLNKLKENTVDVAILDLDMGVLNGEETFDLIKQRYPGVAVIILTGHRNESFVIRFVKKGLPAILSKTTPTKTIVEAIRSVYENGFYYDDFVSSVMAKAISGSAQAPSVDRPELNLNFQEIQVLKLMCLGFSTKMIAEKLHRSERTIDYNRNCIWHKTEIKSKGIPELILYALKHQILSIM